MLFVAFTAGAVDVCAILIPVHGSTVASLTQPVTLFETILTDLEQAYVDPIDTNKPFETGVSAIVAIRIRTRNLKARREAVRIERKVFRVAVWAWWCGKPRSVTFQKSFGGNDASAAAAKKVLPKAVKDGGDDVSSLSSTNSNSIRAL
jgi:hypothetical protein